MAEKFTNRMALTLVANGNITEEVKTWAINEIAKLDKKNAKRKTAEGELKDEHKEIAKAITEALANGSMLSVDLAKAIGQTPQKTNGVAIRMVNLGMLTSAKVKVKNKGEQTAYTLATIDAEGSGVEEE